MNDNQIKKYFLGHLDQSTAQDFEQKSAVSGELTEQAQIVESELIEQYLLDALSDADRTAFENNYLTTESRRRRLALAQIFERGIKAQAATVPLPKAFWRNIFASFQFKIAAAAVILICILAGIFALLPTTKPIEIVRQSNINQNSAPAEINKNIAENQNAANINNPQTANRQPRNTNAEKPKKQPLPVAAPTPNEPLKPTFAVFTLFPGTVRTGGEQFIKISPETDQINLRLKLPKDAAVFQTYAVNIKTADGANILTAPNLKSLNLSIPAAKLKNDIYVVFLDGNNPSKPAESITEYTFRVSR